DGGGFCQRAVPAAGQGDDGGGQFAERAEQPDDLLAFAGVRQDHGDIIRVDHAQVAVHCLGGVEQVGAGAGGIQGADDLGRDVGRLADAGDADATAAGGEQVHGPDEAVV